MTFFENFERACQIAREIGASTSGFTRAERWHNARKPIPQALKTAHLGGFNHDDRQTIKDVASQTAISQKHL